ncbi:hypothetical protein [Arcticibacter sp. MXS-1]|uniref:hypothetical protein n=1 Tax=Arcticibacter sp. MXS-1 TaxID=3341726 RepID=UPI0035A955C0
MEDTIKVQEEFENLIDQLKQLRKVNELTSENTENAKRIIGEVEIFVASTNSYKEKIEADLQLKSTQIETLIGTLDQSILSLKTHASELNKSIEQSFNGFKSSTETTLHEVSQQVGQTAAKVEHGVSGVRETVSFESHELARLLTESIEGGNTVLEKNIEVGLGKMNTTIGENYLTLINKVSSLEKQLKTIKALLFLLVGFLCIGCIAIFLYSGLSL